MASSGATFDFPDYLYALGSLFLQKKTKIKIKKNHNTRFISKRGPIRTKGK